MHLYNSQFGKCSHISYTVVMSAEVIDDSFQKTYLHAVNGQAWTCVELLVADVTFEMLCLLVLYQNLFIIKLTVTIPVRWLRKNKNALFLVYKHSILFVHHSCNISIRIICMWAIDNRLCRKKPKMLNLLLLQNLHSDSYSVSVLLQKENLWIGSPKWFCKSIVDYQTLYICIDLSHPIYFSDTNFIT